jgi:ankyrin
MAITEAARFDSATGRLLKAADQCDSEAFIDIVQKEDVRLDTTAIDGTTPLITASYSGCLSIIDFILAQKLLHESTDNEVDVEAVGLHGANALMAAAARGHADAVGLLILKGGANVNATHRFAGTTALHMAAEMSRAAAVTTLCKHGASVLAVTSTGSTPLHTAAHSGASRDTIAALIRDCGSDPATLMNGDTTALYLAAQFGHTETVRALMEYGADPGFAMPRTAYKGETFLTNFGTNTDSSSHVSPLNSEPGNGAQPIHAASENGHAETVRTLLELGADINSMTMGVTPLHLAAQYNRLDVARVLVTMGADTNVRTYIDGSTALYYAAGHGQAEMVDLLLTANASVSLRQKRSGGFPLLYAAMMGDAAIVKKLLNAGAMPNDAADDGLRPVHAAAAIGSVSVIEALVNYQPTEDQRKKKTVDSGQIWGLDLLLSKGRYIHAK